MLENNEANACKALASVVLAMRSGRDLKTCFNQNVQTNEQNFRTIINTLQPKRPIMLKPYSQVSKRHKDALGITAADFAQHHAVTYRYRDHAKLLVVVGTKQLRRSDVFLAEVLKHEIAHCLTGALCVARHRGARAATRCTPVKFTRGIDCKNRETGFAVESLTRGFCMDYDGNKPMVYKPCGKTIKTMAYLPNDTSLKVAQNNTPPLYKHMVRCRSAQMISRVLQRDKEWDALRDLNCVGTQNTLMSGFLTLSSD